MKLELIEFYIITPVLDADTKIREYIERVCRKAINAQQIIVDGDSTDHNIEIISRR